MPISDTARIVLTGAAARDDHLAVFHKKLPTAARNKVIDSLLRQRLLEETAGAYRAAPLSEQDDSLLLTTLRITDAGLGAIGPHVTAEFTVPVAEVVTAPPAATDATVAKGAAAVPGAGVIATQAPTVGTPARSTLRQAAQAVLAAWEDEAIRETDIAAALDGPMTSLRVLLTQRAPRAVGGTPRTPRTGTKQETVLTLLRRDEGASGPQIAGATGWAPHTVRGFLAGLKKKGFSVETLERVRQVGPNKQGAMGAYSIYRVANAVADDAGEATS